MTDMYQDGKPTAPPEDIQAIVDNINAQVKSTVVAEGVPMLAESDPEYTTFKAELHAGVAEKNMARILSAAQIAAKAKATRLAEEGKATGRTLLERAHNPAHGSNKPTPQPTPPTSGRRYLEQAHSNKGE